jgi:hypothetical protein
MACGEGAGAEGVGFPTGFYTLISHDLTRWLALEARKRIDPPVTPTPLTLII